MAGEFEKLAYEAALRSLDKQEGLLEELRARTGVLLAASSLAASFLGQQAFKSPSPHGLAIAVLTRAPGWVEAGVARRLAAAHRVRASSLDATWRRILST